MLKLFGWCRCCHISFFVGRFSTFFKHFFSCDLVPFANSEFFIILSNVCVFYNSSEFMYFHILDSIGFWLIFESCSHLQNRPRSFFNGSWKALMFARWSCARAWVAWCISKFRPLHHRPLMGNVSFHIQKTIPRKSTKTVNSYFLFARRKSWKTHCGTSAATQAQCLWNRRFYGIVFPGVWGFDFNKCCCTAGFALNSAQKRTPRECIEFGYKWVSGNDKRDMQLILPRYSQNRSVWGIFFKFDPNCVYGVRIIVSDFQF